MRIQLPKYQDNENPVLHVRELTKVCVINGENIDNHKLQYFPNYLKGRVTNWFGKYEIAHPKTTWAQVQRAFITWFSEIKTRGQTVVTL